MRILMFGRGVIATIYGLALQGAGHDVEFYVRPGRATEYGDEVRTDLLDARNARRGRRSRRTAPIRLRVSPSTQQTASIWSSSASPITDSRPRHRTWLPESAMPQYSYSATCGTSPSPRPHRFQPPRPCSGSRKPAVGSTMTACCTAPCFALWSLMPTAGRRVYGTLLSGLPSGRQDSPFEANRICAAGCGCTSSSTPECTHRAFATKDWRA